MEEKFLDADRFQKLVNMGVTLKKSPMFCWVIYGDSSHIMFYDSDVVDNIYWEKMCPALMAQDLCELLPVRLMKYSLKINLKRRVIEYSDGEDKLIEFSYCNGGSLLNAAYEAMCWATEMLNSNKKK